MAGVNMHGRGCVTGMVRGMHGRGVWQGGMHGRGVHGRIDSHCSGRYASYWNAFLLLKMFGHNEQFPLRPFVPFQVALLSSGYRFIDAMLFWELKIGCKKDCFCNAPFSIAN